MFVLICTLYGQIIELLHFKDKLTARQFQRVATRAALTIVEEKPQFGQQYLLEPLLGPLQRCCSMATGQNDTHGVAYCLMLMEGNVKLQTFSCKVMGEANGK